jgi:hypothetical protein
MKKKNKGKNKRERKKEEERRKKRERRKKEMEGRAGVSPRQISLGLAGDPRLGFFFFFFFFFPVVDLAASPRRRRPSPSLCPDTSRQPTSQKVDDRPPRPMVRSRRP